MTEQTGVAFGPEQRNTLTGPPGSDFVVFTRFTQQQGKFIPGHVMFGSNRGGSTYFYDPQAGGAKIRGLSEPYVSYRVEYPR
jgi:hypothetical protein